MKKQIIPGLTTLFAASVIASGPVGAQQIDSSAGDLTFRGDLRYRHEQISEENKNQRDRERIRVRFGATAVVHPNITLTFGIASGSDDSPVSSNQDLSGGFSDKSLWIDQAFFTWSTPLAGLKALGGKMKNPFSAPGKSQLIWDGDLNPEGIAAQYSRRTAKTELFASAAIFSIQERSADDDSYLLGIQTGAKRTFGRLSATAGAGIFNYVNNKGFDTFYEANTAAGNTLSGGKYVYDYQIVEAFGELALPKAIVPVSLAVDYVTNIASNVEDDQGYLAGVTLGKTTPGAFSGRVFYRYLEKDAVIGTFSDSDFAGGGTDNKGTILGLDYQASKNVSLSSTFFLTEKGVDNGTGYNRLQLDTNFKF